VRTPGREGKNDVIVKSVADAVHELDSTLGPEMKQWRWGSLHTVEFQHLFGRRKPLDRVFNIGPHPVPGTGTTVSKTMFDFAHPYAVFVGPSMREIIDLSSADRIDLVITTGQSGQALNKHYDDQTPLWLNGGYHTVSMDWQKLRSSGFERLELEPAAQ
jgi:penicillin amidase